MVYKLSYSPTFRLVLLTLSTALLTASIVSGPSWEVTCPAAIAWLAAFVTARNLYKRHAQKVAFMFDAINNNDYTFKFPSQGYSSSDTLVSQSLNRIIQVLFQAKAEAAQQEKYYELIMSVVNTGIIVVDDKGNIYQKNNEALRLLGLTILTHVKQLARVDETLERTIEEACTGDHRQVTFTNERGTVSLSIRVSEMTRHQTHLRIMALNDINNELDQKEIDSWIRLTRVLTHEIMNSVTPITSLSDTLLSMHGDTDAEIRNGLEVISSTGKSLIAFVESYRKFTHLPTPQPTLFYVKKFAVRMVQLTRHHLNYPNIAIEVAVKPDDLILYADENLISQVVLNLLKNAMQAIGDKQDNGLIRIKAYCASDEAVIIEVSNNGPLIPPEEADHIFIPFFTTKEGGSGIGLSVSRQIMRLTGGSIALKSYAATGETAFILRFP